MAFETIKDNLIFTQTIVGDISATGNFYNTSGLVTGSGGGADSGVRALSANWQSTYTTVLAQSASWIGGGGALPEKTKLTGNGSTNSFSIHGTYTNAAAYRVDINGVVQEPTVGASVGDYSISAPGTLLFSTAPANGTKIVVIG